MLVVFGSIMGTPIINQPQVGILALGAIRKMPSVIETSEGDFIGIRNKMFLSHSYDHIDVICRIQNYASSKGLEAFDMNIQIKEMDLKKSGYAGLFFVLYFPILIFTL